MLTIGVITIINVLFAFLLVSRIGNMILQTYLTLILLINVFIVLIILNLKRLKLLSSTILISLSFYIIFFISFRNIRNFFPKPNLSNSEIVGFTQYFDYPAEFDLFFFLVLISIPSIAYLMINKLMHDSK